MHNSNPLEKDYSDLENFVQNGLSSEQALAKLRKDNVLPNGAENDAYLRIIWDNGHIQSSADFLKSYNNKDVVPTLEAMQKKFDCHHDKGIDMLKLGCTLPFLANSCLHESTDSKLYPFSDRDKYRLEKIREDMFGGLSLVFNRKALVDETYIRKLTNLCKSIARIDASQLHPCSMFQLIPTGLCSRWEYENETQRFTPCQNNLRSFENMVLSYFQRLRPECRIASSVSTGQQKKLIASVKTEFANIVTLFLKLLDVFITLFFIKKHDLLWVIDISRAE